MIVTCYNILLKVQITLTQLAKTYLTLKFVNSKLKGPTLTVYLELSDVGITNIIA